MFEIDHMDFIGNDAFNEMVDYVFGKRNTRRVVDDDGVKSVRVYLPGRKPAEGNCDISLNEQPTKIPSWCKEVRGNVDIPEWTETPSKPSPKPEPKPEPKSILEMLEDGDERLERILGDIIDKKLAERNIVGKTPAEEDGERIKTFTTPKDPYVFIANRLTFLIQTLQPIVFDTSNIEVTPNSLTIAVNEKKTFPRIAALDELGFITSKINASPTVIQEIEDYLKGTGYTNIFCFPTTTEDRDGNDVLAVRFVVYRRPND